MSLISLIQSDESVHEFVLRLKALFSNVTKHLDIGKCEFRLTIRCKETTIPYAIGLEDSDAFEAIRNKIRTHAQPSVGFDIKCK